MNTNRMVLRRLVDEGMAAINWGSWLDTQPKQARTPPFDRFEGMMLGLAAGDSLGNRSEGKNPDERFELFGEITDYPHGETGLPSDDTQLSFWTLESLLEHGRLDPAALSEAFRHKHIYGIGKTVKEFLSNTDKGLPWERRGVASAGNGALMRIAPVVFPHLRSPTAELWADAAIAAMITHNDSAAISSAVAFASILWECLHMDTTPAAEWWVEQYLRVAPGLETETRYLPRTPGALRRFTLSEFVADYVMAAYDRRLSLRDAQRD